MDLRGERGLPGEPVQLEETREMLAILVRGNPDMCSEWFLESAWLGDELKFLGAMEGIGVGRSA